MISQEVKNTGQFQKGGTPWNSGKQGWTKKKLKYDYSMPYQKSCPTCNKIMTYSSKYSLHYSILENRNCNTCGNKGKGFQSTYYGYDRTVDINQKSRESAIHRIEQSKGQINPNYNKSSIAIIEAKAMELGITDLMHAENGGEYRIAGYFLDGYSPSTNIAFEFDEKGHFDKFGNLKKRDVIRQSKIEQVLGCTFIRIKENK